MALDAFSRNAKPLPLPLPPTPPPPSPPTQTIINKQVGRSGRESSSRVYRGRLIAYYSLFTAFVYDFFFPFQPVYSLLWMIMIEIKRKQTCNRKKNIDLVNKWHYMRLENWKCSFLFLRVIGCAVLHHHSHFQMRLLSSSYMNLWKKPCFVFRSYCVPLPFTNAFSNINTMYSLLFESSKCT